MASLSSLFGIGTQPQQQPQAAAVTTQELPKQVAPYYEKLLKEAEALYKQKMEAGAPIYEGKTMAGFTPEQEQLFTGLQGLQGTQAPKFAEAEALTRGTAEKITPDEVQEYMNPYQQAVVDIEKREAQKQYESTVVPQLAAQAAGTGGFGGSRQAILEGMASEANQRLLGDIQAKGTAQAYQDAMTNIQQQRQREGAAGAQLAQMAPAGFQAQAQELGAIGKVGDAKQQQAQLALDEAYKQYMQEQQFPSESLKEYQSYVQSFPNIPTQITRTPPPQQPGLAQSLLGLGTTALGTYGAFGGFSPGGFMGMKQGETGGGIAGLPVVYRQNSGKVNLPGTAVSRFLKRNVGEPLGIPGLVDEEDETYLGTGLKGSYEGIKGALKTYASPLDFIIGRDPKILGYSIPSAPELLTTAGKKLIETKGARTQRLEDEAFDKEYKDDTLNKKVQEEAFNKQYNRYKALGYSDSEAKEMAEKNKSISMDPITPDQKEKSALMIEQDAKKAAIADALDQEEALKKELKKVKKNTPEETAIKNQIAQLKEAYGKIGEYKAPDTTGVTTAMDARTKLKKDVITRLDNEGKEIDEQRIRDISVGAIDAGKAIMSAPNLITALNAGLGVFGKKGKEAMDTAKDKKKVNKEKAEAIGLEIANDNVAKEQFILSMKTDTDAKKAERIMDKIQTGVAISTAESNFMNAQTNRIDAETKKIIAKNEGIPDTASFSKTELAMSTNVANTFKDEIAKSINVPDMDKDDKETSVKKLIKDDKFMMKVTSAWKTFEAGNPKSNMDQMAFVKGYVQQYIERNPEVRLDDWIPNWIW